jgi:hypothetical protein
MCQERLLPSRRQLELVSRRGEKPNEAAAAEEEESAYDD